jgi:hypothetical protein
MQQVVLRALGFDCLSVILFPVPTNANDTKFCWHLTSQVLSEYRRRGMDFVMQVINEPTYLEDLTGLTELMKSASCSQVEWVDEIDEDDFVEV